MTGRILWKDTPDRFGAVSIALHWINALFVIALLVMGLIIWPLPRGAERSTLLHWHMSLALVLLPFVIARLAWRLRYGKPVTRHRSALSRMTADVVWRVLLAGVVLQMLSGPLLVWMHDRPLEIFGLVSIPSPLPPHLEQWRDVLVKPVHQAISVIIGAALVLHVLGALKHRLIDRDGVTERMLMPPRGP